MSPSPTWDVAIVGAGLAGASAAAVLGRQGVRTALIDAQTTFPCCFKAEKIEPDQADLFRKLGLIEGLQPVVHRIHEVATGYDGRILLVNQLEQYGTLYHDMVNAVRAQIPEHVARKVDRVRAIVPDADVSRVTLLSGESIRARLVVLACGTGGNLHAGLGLTKRMIAKNHSLAAGFNIARADEQPFPFDSLTYHSETLESRVAYLTLFPIRDVMRANFFIYRTTGEEWLARFAKEPERAITGALPRLTQITGAFRVTGRVEMKPVDLYQVVDPARPGLVLVADAYQSVCPTTGTGLSKVLTDVDVLCNECIPQWLATPGMGIDKIARYYEHPRKRACDSSSLRDAAYIRSLSLELSIPWQLRRFFTFQWMFWSGLVSKALRARSIDNLQPTTRKEPSIRPAA
jgi:2-polyprenyl-6-methoxyphenol hydroxylase-like FAD-dependent oxidoreductase